MSPGASERNDAVMETKRTQVFIVDDSAPIRARLVEMLGHIDTVAIAGQANNAADAISGILRTQPNIVLLDLNLGGSTGMSVLHAVRPQAPDISFVVLTNHSEPQYRSACAKAGADYFFDKSTEFDRVAQVIASASVH